MKIALVTTIQLLTAIVLSGNASSALPASARPENKTTLSSHREWVRVADSSAWSRRAGLQVVELHDRLYLMGGRTPLPPSFPPIPGASEIHGDVYRSDDQGISWSKLLDTDTPGHWQARAYFQAVTKGRYMYVLGGQNFRVSLNPACPPPYINCSPVIDSTDFFNDVWRSGDGINWTLLTDSAGWEGRAGLSAVVFRDEIYVMGGSQRNDSSIIGGSPRTYYNDVWKSADGRDWVQLTDSADWAPRAGAIAVSQGDYMYLLGGEFGFTCDPIPFCDPPYFNDVWRSQDGATWELVTDSAAWSPRPGHQVAVVGNRFVLFGGFGLLGNPVDMWTSTDGFVWSLMDDTPWNAVTPDEIRYDFDLLVVKNRGTDGKSILTFGGDRETFDFSDTTNYLRVENDVWRYGVPVADGLLHPGSPSLSEGIPSAMQLEQNYPNPFNPSTIISYALSEDSRVSIRVYNMLGQEVASLVDGFRNAGTHSVQWDGGNLANGVYVYRMTAGSFTQTRKLTLLK